MHDPLLTVELSPILLAMGRLEHLAAFWRRRGLRKASRRLSQALAADYGASASYTLGQINAAMSKSSTPARLRPFGFAAFLDEETYASLSMVEDRAEDYNLAMATFLKAGGSTASAYAFERDHGDHSSIVQAPLDGF